VLGIARACLEQVVRNFRIQLGFPSTDYLRHARRSIRRRRVTTSQVLRVAHFGRVDVRHCHLLDARGAGLDQIHCAPIGQTRHGEACDGGERRLVIERRYQRFARLRQKFVLIFVPLQFGDIAEDQDDANHLSGFVANWGSAVVDRNFWAGLGQQHGVVGQADDFALAQHFADWALDDGPRALRNDVKNRIQGLPDGFRFVPPREPFGDWVQKGHFAEVVSGDHGVPDAAQRGAEPAPSLLLGFGAGRSQQCLRALVGERVDEGALVLRKPSRFVEPDPQQTERASFRNERHAPKSLGPTPGDLAIGQAGIELGVVGLAFYPDGATLFERREGARVARPAAPAEAANFFEYLGVHAPSAEQLEPLLLFVQYVKGTRVTASSIHAVLDHHIGNIGGRARKRQRSSELGQRTEPRSCRSCQRRDPRFVALLATPGKQKQRVGSDRDYERRRQRCPGAARRNRPALVQQALFAGANLRHFRAKVIGQPLAFAE
jgi:hypothetical protein